MIQNNTTDASVSPSQKQQLPGTEQQDVVDTETQLHQQQQHANSVIASLPEAIREQIWKHAIHAPQQQQIDAQRLGFGDVGGGGGGGGFTKANLGMQRDSGIDTSTAASLEALQNYALHAPFL
ncbi:hypothetical protein EV175_005537, partial [Coemansia sp. RSA 1933]